MGYLDEIGNHKGGIEMIIKGVLIILIITLNIVVSIKFIEFNKWKKDFINRINKAHAE